MQIHPWQQILAREKSPEWTGDLDDDCTSLWAGLMLRAEHMHKSHWWWAVSDMESGEEIASSNQTSKACRSGRAARLAAENAAREYLSVEDGRAK
ncbi:MAG: hypothetical protein K8T91_06075 [Planctomycetes bacterium]|nr:hypothetical protein [Planctomycetota bacterium]